MPAENTLQLVIQVEANKANNSIKSVNASLSSLESTAVSAARGASQGVDGLTASVAKGAAAGTLLAHAFEKVVGWVKVQAIADNPRAVQAATTVDRAAIVFLREHVKRSFPAGVLGLRDQVGYYALVHAAWRISPTHAIYPNNECWWRQVFYRAA